MLAVVSQDAPPYREALASFRQRLERESSPAVVHRDSARRRSPLARPEALSATQADLVLTLGTLATRESLRRFPATPLVAGMILSPDELGGADQATGVFLQFPIETELEWLARLLPSLAAGRGDLSLRPTPSSGSPARSVSRRRSNLTIQAYHIDGPQELPDALENLADRADVLWGVTDPVVFNPETAKSLLLFSFRHQIPLIGQSTPWVKAGALYALDRDYGDIGMQCAELAQRILAGRAPSTLPPVPPRKIRYSLNRKTAEQMKLETCRTRRSATPRKWWSDRMRTGALSLAAKLRLLTTGAVLLTTLSVLGVAANRAISDSAERLSRKGQTLGLMIAQNSEFAVYTQNADALRQIAQGLRADPEVAYVRFQAADGHELHAEVLLSGYELPPFSRGLPGAAGALGAAGADRPPSGRGSAWSRRWRGSVGAEATAGGLLSGDVMGQAERPAQRRGRCRSA